MPIFCVIALSSERRRKRHYDDVISLASRQLRRCQSTPHSMQPQNDSLAAHCCSSLSLKSGLKYLVIIFIRAFCDGVLPPDLY